MIVPASQDLFLVGKIGDGKMGGILETSRHKNLEGRNASRIIWEARSSDITKELGSVWE